MIASGANNFWRLDSATCDKCLALWMPLRLAMKGSSKADNSNR